MVEETDGTPRAPDPCPACGGAMRAEEPPDSVARWVCVACGETIYLGSWCPVPIPGSPSPALQKIGELGRRMGADADDRSRQCVREERIARQERMRSENRDHETAEPLRRRLNEILARWTPTVDEDPKHATAWREAAGTTGKQEVISALVEVARSLEGESASMKQMTRDAERAHLVALRKSLIATKDAIGRAQEAIPKAISNLRALPPSVDARLGAEPIPADIADQLGGVEGLGGVDLDMLDALADQAKVALDAMRQTREPKRETPAEAMGAQAEELTVRTLDILTEHGIPTEAWWVKGLKEGEASSASSAVEILGALGAALGIQNSLSRWRDILRHVKGGRTM